MTWREGFDETLAAARRAEPWALEQIWRELHPGVLGYLRAQAGADAEDLASEVFIRVAQGVRRFEGDQAAFRSWTFTIAHHRLVDHRRAEQRHRHKTEALRAQATQICDAEAEAIS